MSSSCRFMLVAGCLWMCDTAYAATRAQEADTDTLQRLLACENIPNQNDKLECFLAATEALKKQQQAPSKTTTANAGEPSTKRAAEPVPPRNDEDTFGFTADEIARRDGRSASKKAQEQIFEFTRYWRDAVGKYYFLMANGQIWKETKGSHLIVPRRAKSIRIKRNIMGGYVAFIEGMNGRRGHVTRVQ